MLLVNCYLGLALGGEKMLVVRLVVEVVCVHTRIAEIHAVKQANS